MLSGCFWLAAVLAVAAAQGGSSIDDVVAELKDQSQCNNRILASKGVRKGGRVKTSAGVVKLDRARNFYRRGGQASVVFQEDKVSIESAGGGSQRVRVPGCFVLKAKDVRINRPLKTLTAEIDMRMGAIPSRTAPVSTWPKPLPCKQQNINSTCGCGLSDSSCFYCDFCKNFNSYIGREGGPPRAEAKPQDIGRKGKVSVFSKEERKWLDLEACNCDIRPGLYDVEAEICTPDAAAIQDVLPQAVVALVDENKAKAAAGGGEETEFTLYSVVTLYDDDFRSVPKGKDKKAKGKLFAHRAKHIVGCHFVVTDVIV